MLCGAGLLCLGNEGPGNETGTEEFMEAELRRDRVGGDDVLSCTRSNYGLDVHAVGGLRSLARKVKFQTALESDSGRVKRDQFSYTDCWGRRRPMMPDVSILMAVCEPITEPQSENAFL